VFFAQNPKSIKTERTSSKLPQKSPKIPRLSQFFQKFLTFPQFFARFRAFSPPIGVFLRAILTPNSPPQLAYLAQIATNPHPFMQNKPNSEYTESSSHPTNYAKTSPWQPKLRFRNGFYKHKMHLFSMGLGEFP